ncbi:MAG: hypothetical protein ACRBM6_25120, partial [Geminicoccales bacterium]
DFDDRPISKNLHQPTPQPAITSTSSAISPKDQSSNPSVDPLAGIKSTEPVALSTSRLYLPIWRQRQSTSLERLALTIGEGFRAEWSFLPGSHRSKSGFN